MSHINTFTAKFSSTSLATALLIALGVNGSVLAGFDQVASVGAAASGATAAHVAVVKQVTLPTVTIVAQRA